MMPTTRDYLGTTKYAEYDGVDDYYSVVQHELGHAFEYGSGDRAAMDALHAAMSRAGGQTVRLEQQVRFAQRSIQEAEKQAERYRLIMADPNNAAGVDYYRRQMQVQLELAERYRRQVDELERLLAEARKLGVNVDRMMTDYSGKNGREDFAEAFWFYLNRPEQLRAKAPARYRFIHDLIANAKGRG
jgi:hypothetical protein